MYDPWTPTTPSRTPGDGPVPATLWALHALGFQVDYTWLASNLDHRQVLTDTRGGQLAVFLGQILSPWGITVDLKRGLGFDDVREQSGLTPLLLYGEVWAHWTGVRGYSPRQDSLMLANPGEDDPQMVCQVLSRAAYLELGPWLLLRIDRPARPRKAVDHAV